MCASVDDCFSKGTTFKSTSKECLLCSACGIFPTKKNFLAIESSTENALYRKIVTEIVIVQILLLIAHLRKLRE